MRGVAWWVLAAGRGRWHGDGWRGRTEGHRRSGVEAAGGVDQATKPGPPREVMREPCLQPHVFAGNRDRLSLQFSETERQILYYPIPILRRAISRRESG